MHHFLPIVHGCACGGLGGRPCVCSSMWREAWSSSLMLTRLLWIHLQAGYKDDLTKEEAMELVARAIRCAHMPTHPYTMARTFAAACRCWR